MTADLALLETRLDAAVLDALRSDVSEDAKREMGRQLGGFRFPRSRGAGGLSDPVNFRAEVEGSGGNYTLTVTDTAPLQRGGGRGGALADAVESGDPAYRMPGPRPFYESLLSFVWNRSFPKIPYRYQCHLVKQRTGLCEKYIARFICNNLQKIKKGIDKTEKMFGPRWLPIKI